MPTILIKRLDQNQVRAMKAFAKKHNGTLNDILVAAMIRALVDMARPDDDAVIRYVGTVDLRRYLPKGQGESICNLSTFYFLNLGKDIGSGFMEAFARTKQGIDKLKNKYFGLSFNLFGYLQVWWFPYAWLVAFMRYFFIKGAEIENLAPALTNMGPIDPAKLDFGALSVSYADLIVPIGKPQGFVPGVSGFGDRLTISLGYYESAFKKQDVDAFFDRMNKYMQFDELPPDTP